MPKEIAVKLRKLVSRGQSRDTDKTGVVWRASTESIGRKCFVVSPHRTGTRAMSEFLSPFLSVFQYPVRFKEIDIESKIRGRKADLEFVAETSARPRCHDLITDVPIPVLYSSSASIRQQNSSCC